jgi:hypothetical protein
MGSPAKSAAKVEVHLAGNGLHCCPAAIRPSTVLSTYRHLAVLALFVIIFRRELQLPTRPDKPALVFLGLKRQDMSCTVAGKEARSSPSAISQLGLAPLLEARQGKIERNSRRRVWLSRHFRRRKGVCKWQSLKWHRCGICGDGIGGRGAIMLARRSGTRSRQSRIGYMACLLVAITDSGSSFCGRSMSRTTTGCGRCSLSQRWRAVSHGPAIRTEAGFLVGLAILTTG